MRPGTQNQTCPACLSYVPEGMLRCPECLHRLGRGRRSIFTAAIVLVAIGIAAGACLLIWPPWGGAPGPDRSHSWPAAGQATPEAGLAGPGNGEPMGAAALLDQGSRPPEPSPGMPGAAPRQALEKATSDVPDRVRLAAQSLVFLQLFDRDGGLRAEAEAAFVDERTVVLSCESLIGAYSGRGWSTRGDYYQVADVRAFDGRLGLAAIRLQGASSGVAIRMRGAAPRPDEPVYVVSPTPGGISGFHVGSLASRAGDPTGGFEYRGRAPASGGWMFDGQGRVIGLLVRSGSAADHSARLEGALAALLASRDGRSLEAFYLEEYQGSPQQILDRALGCLRRNEHRSALDSFLELARVSPPMLSEHRTRLASALLGTIEEARATGRYDEVLSAVEEILEQVGSLAAVRLHAGRLFLDASRYDPAVRMLLEAAESDPQLVSAVSPLLFLAYSRWGELLLHSGRATAAASVYEQGLLHLSEQASLYYGLGKARAALGDYEGARIAMEEALIRDPRLSSVVEPDLEDVYLHLGGDGILTIDIPKDSRLIPVEVLVNHSAIETMYIDSGASWTFLTRAFADRLGLAIDSRTPRARFATANGEVTLPVVVLEEVNFRGFVVRDVEAAIGDLSEQSFQGGVLGNNFLKHFTITIDRPRGKMTFETVR